MSDFVIQCGDMYDKNPVICGHAFEVRKHFNALGEFDDPDIISDIIEDDPDLLMLSQLRRAAERRGRKVAIVFYDK